MEERTDMKTPFNALFLSQSYQDAWDDYTRSLTYPVFARWDYVVLTAANEKQAAGFRLQVEYRQRHGFLPKDTQFLVVPDVDGQRIGSGGATLGVLRRIAELRGNVDFTGLRILVIHSGGDSKRIPQYSAQGKLFSPVPRELPDGRASTLFDELLIATAGVPARIPDGMLVMSGDVLLLFNPLQIDFSGHNAAALSFKESADVGKNHGVFLRGEDGTVAQFLHKQSVDSLRHIGAVNDDGRVDIDTGAVLFSVEVLQALMQLVLEEGRLHPEKFSRYVSRTACLSLYGDFLYPMASRSTLEEFWEQGTDGVLDDALREIRTELWNTLHRFSLKLLRLAPAKFLHFGTTREIWRLMVQDTPQYRQLGWTQTVNSSLHTNEISGYNSVLDSGADCQPGCYLEASYVHRGASVGEGAVISHVDLYSETVPARVVFHGLKLQNGKFTVRIFDVDANPKVTLEEGGELFGVPLDAFLQSRRLPMEALWDSEPHSIWKAKLYPVCDTIQQAAAAALNVYALICGGGDFAAWYGATRESLESSFTDADPAALLAWNNRMQELVHMHRLAAMIAEERPVSDVTSILKEGSLTAIQQEWLQSRLTQAEFGERMRLNYYVGYALGGMEGERYIADCFQQLHGAVIQQERQTIQADADLRICKDTHTVRLPLRVNWGGGWSDTPPYCYEHGGTVLNAAILLRGEMPVEVTLTRLDEPKVVFLSRDMDSYGEFCELAPLQRTGDPYDPFALQKAALLACGVLPMSGGTLPDILARMGGGFRLQTEVKGVPKGSGLGTSSILAGGCVKAIHEFFGIPYTEETLYSRVLCMEQIMSTGGGWQDQVGGLTPGIKYTMSQPGFPQVLRVQPVTVSEAAKRQLNERFCLIYTGQRRLARNLLRDVIQRYIGNQPQVVAALYKIQRIATLMRFELERGNLDALAELMEEHWELSQEIDPGTTNTLINQIFASAEDLIAGRMICGAGGGGFLQVLLKAQCTKAMLHERLRATFQDCEIGVWDAELYF